MPRPWSFPVALDPDSAEPLSLQISRAISEDVRKGRLRAGAVLPGSRTLAETVGVHRNTVLAAYRELEAEGWIEAGHRSTRIAEDLPLAPARSRPLNPGLGFALEMPPPFPGPIPGPPGALRMGGGTPDIRLVPRDILARAYRRALRSKDTPLDYGDPQGDHRFRSALAGLLAEMRGLACGPERIMATAGSQMGLDLVARALIRPGDAVGVEDPGYPMAWAALRAAGAEVIPLPVDANGLRVEALEELLAKRPVRLLYTTPHHQFPTTVTMSAPRRLHLLALARRHRMAIVEDDYDFEFHFEGRPVLPLASNDEAGVVIYLGTLSKVLAPGLRLGFVAGPLALVRALASRRAFLDRQGDQVLERAVAELIEDGLLQRHGRKMRRLLQERRDALAEALHKRFREEVVFPLPSGGMCLWAEARLRNPGAWIARCRAAGAIFPTGAAFDFKGRDLPFLRLGFATLDPGELREVVKRMGAALR